MVSRSLEPALTTLFVAFGLATAVAAMKPGGWSEVSVTDEGVVAAAAYAVQAEQAAMRKNGDQTKLSLLRVAAAEQQVVQGMNYRLTLHLQSETGLRTAVAVVWARLWLDEADRYQLTSWTYTDGPPAKGGHDGMPNAIGW